MARLQGEYAIDARTMGNRTQEFQDETDPEAWKKKYLHDAATLLDCLENPDNPRRCKPYQVSIDSWKVWAKKNDCEVFILDQ